MLITFLKVSDKSTRSKPSTPPSPPTSGQLFPSVRHLLVLAIVIHPLVEAAPQLQSSFSGFSQLLRQTLGHIGLCGSSHSPPPLRTAVTASVWLPVPSSATVAAGSSTSNPWNGSGAVFGTRSGREASYASRSYLYMKRRRAKGCSAKCCRAVQNKSQ